MKYEYQKLTHDDLIFYIEYFALSWQDWMQDEMDHMGIIFG